MLNAATRCVIHWPGDRTGLVFQAVTSPLTSGVRNVAKTSPDFQDGSIAALPAAIMARVHLTGKMPADFATVPTLPAGTALPAK